MEDFIPKNIYIRGLKGKGLVEQTLRDGRKRTIDTLNYSVKIEDKTGTILYSEKLEKSHPLIENAYNYYYWNAIRKFSKKPTFTDIKLNQYMKSTMSESRKPCEEYYKIIYRYYYF